MLFKLIREEQKTTFQPFMRREASDLKLKEKDLENWIAENPELLFGAEQILVISQSVSGQRMADILALDVEGRLVIVEIKRDWADRETVGQLLEYAANMAGYSYEELESLDRKYWNLTHGNDQYVPLLKRFQDLTEDEATENDIPKGQRICIVAPRSDEGLSQIVKWLKEYGVPISFVPFTLYTDDNNEDILLEMKPIPMIQAEQRNVASEEERDRFFNTNERHAPGAYHKMFKQGVIAIYGYANGPSNLQGSTAGQRVFAYVSGKGIVAVGRIVDGQVVPGNTVFGQRLEYHVKVKWETIVPTDRAVTLTEVKQKFGYRLPRSVFCKMYCPPDVTNWIADELLRRAGGTP